jgi:hypothetical protein
VIHTAVAARVAQGIGAIFVPAAARSRFATVTVAAMAGLALIIRCAFVSVFDPLEDTRRPDTDIPVCAMRTIGAGRITRLYRGDVGAGIRRRRAFVPTVSPAAGRDGKTIPLPVASIRSNTGIAVRLV